MPGSIPVLSDHAYQSTLFEAVNPKSDKTETFLFVGTWNMQDKCHSKASHATQAFANNPYDEDESKEHFDIRKREQFKKIEQNIANGGDDIVFLQEIDFLIRKEHQALKAEFEAMLKKHGYRLTLTPNSPNQQSMALIFNNKKLKPVASQGVFPEPSKQKYRGYETTFTHRQTGQTIVATNLHLLYGRDYKTEIEDYQRMFETSANHHGRFLIMGGDTNNIQNANLNTALGDWRKATNFSRDPNTQQLTTQHNTDSTKQKAYDRFFAVPPPGCFLRAIPTKRTEQVIIDQQGHAQFMGVSERRSSTSRVGERWRRGKDIMKELEQVFLTASNKDKPDLLKKMQEVIQLKKLNIQTCFTDISVQQAYQTFQPLLSHQGYYQFYIDKTNRPFQTGRFHLFTAHDPKNQIKGDALKSEILDDFFTRIDDCVTKPQLETLLALFKNEEGYKTLETGQGFFTRLFNLKTSSIIALENKYKDKMDELDALEAGNQPDI